MGENIQISSAFSIEINEDADAWTDPVSDAFDIEKDVVNAEIASSGVELDTLTAKSQAAFESPAAMIRKNADDIIQIANNMGLGSGWGFVAGDAYQNMITNDNDEINEDYGWNILQAEKMGRPIAYLSNHAFISEGHLIFYWNSQDVNGFWVTHSESF